jgi:hypothetical protein
MYLITSVGDVFDWIAAHLGIIGWPALLGLVWKFRGAVDKFLADQKESTDKVAKVLETVEEAKRVAIMKVEEAKEHGSIKAEEIKHGIDVLDANHLTHMERDMSEQTKLLISIDKNIAVLVDRARS